MAACDQVKLLLGPFEDGELEPHEMEDVALHIVTCHGCKDALDDYRSLAVALRDCLPQPALEGFAAGVLARIEEIPQPFRLRWRSYLEALSEPLSAATLVAAGAFVALVTAWLVTPYAHLLLHHPSNLNQVASVQNDSTTTAQRMNAAGHDAPLDQPQPSVLALSNDPTTTVIWLPNQP